VTSPGHRDEDTRGRAIIFLVENDGWRQVVTRDIYSATLHQETGGACTRAFLFFEEAQIDKGDFLYRWR
jgi:hypothetical protein